MIKACIVIIGFAGFYMVLPQRSSEINNSLYLVHTKNPKPPVVGSYATFSLKILLEMILNGFKCKLVKRKRKKLVDLLTSITEQKSGFLSWLFHFTPSPSTLSLCYILISLLFYQNKD